MSDSLTKKCSRCQQMLSRDAFARNKASRDGLQAYCRKCWAEYYQERQAARGKIVRQKVEVPEGYKFCRTCEQIKPHSEWCRNRTAPDGLDSRCKSCKASKGRASYFKRAYGITEAQRDEMIASQYGVCTICLKAPAVHVDHCHETGRVRGVLCFNCNAALGQLGDDPDTLHRAIAYLEGNAWKPTLVAPGVYQLPS
ncbi:recombination endonuclease VII [Streptomyces spiroverticillatus]|uniref:Recombination endonuclease VII n=1 Tax=Streptomyces finlayi TaxID=67296 RepID=A0A919CBZ3_9ACTN|nr:endonuclease VII domain-containing protein [Streptomyces finlayi]GHA48248.1 recombination endonuclease VII [Streptomyces spiroverticillatus]GHD01178.1 recombination endonuclease VII [Streptomyces finlayi]